MEDLILAVEIGGTKLQVGLGTSQGQLLQTARTAVEPTAGAAGILDWLTGAIPTMLQRAGVPSAIGVGFGGPVETKTGRVITSNQIEGWHDFPLRDWFEDAFHLPTRVDNDAQAAAWGEFRLGLGRGTRQFFYTNIGSGVGGGLVLDGALFNGQGWGAGEIGHMLIPDWTAGEPGVFATVEKLCSGWAIEARLRQDGYAPEDSLLFRADPAARQALGARDLAKAARNGDPFARAEIRKVAESFGAALVNVLSLTSVERIAVGGGVSALGESLLAPMRQWVQAHAFMPSLRSVQINRAWLGEEVVLVGALLRAAELVD